jgi:TATA-binding protein-associated factor
VRSNVARALTDLLNHAQPLQWAAPIMAPLFDCVFRSFLSESRDDNLQGLHVLWRALLDHSPPQSMVACKAVLPLLSDWYQRMSEHYERASFVLAGCEAISNVLRIWPPSHLASQVAVLLKMIFATNSGRDKLVGCVCVALFARRNDSILPELAQLLSQKLLELLRCNWTTLQLGDVPAYRRSGVRSTVACAWVSVFTQQQPPPQQVPPADWQLVIDALLGALESEADKEMQKFASEFFAQLLRWQDALEPSAMSQLCRLLLLDRRLTPQWDTSDDVVSISPDQSDAAIHDDPALVAARNATRGAILGFGALGRVFEVSLLDSTRNWWRQVLDPFATSTQQQAIVDSLRVIHTVVQSVSFSGSAAVVVSLTELLTFVTGPALEVTQCLVARLLLGECVASIAQICPSEALKELCVTVLPREHSNVALAALLGAIHAVLVSLQVVACPFIAFMVVPVLGAMSNRDETVRKSAAAAFAQLVGLMALEAAVPDPPSFGDVLSARRIEERKFIAQLVGGKPPPVDNESLGLVLDLKLRSYQLAGISWLVFLARYKLHGVMADDMGLGKTVQVEKSFFLESKRFVLLQNKALCAVSFAQRQCSSRRQSLIVCPASVVDHWIYESKSLFTAKVFSPLCYMGSPAQRKQLRSTFTQHDLIVTSYEVLR